MKIRLLALLLIPLLPSCITPYEPEGIFEGDILVVEGTITQGTTVIKLSRSVPLDQDIKDMKYINNALVEVERSDGTVYAAPTPTMKGYYAIEVGTLDPDLQYRLTIKHDGKEYRSEYLSPIMTTDIDEILIEKESGGSPVKISVSARDTDNRSRYYKWRYDEEWEIRSQLYADGTIIVHSPTEQDTIRWSPNGTPNPIYYCWCYVSSDGIIIENTAAVGENAVKKVLIEQKPTNNRFSVLYRIKVYQHQIRKEAYDYFANVQKNSEDMGGIFSPIPSEIKGNITCVSDSDIPVIGFVEVSATATKEFMGDLSGLYEDPNLDCTQVPDQREGYMYVIVPKTSPPMEAMFAPRYCVDCTYFGTKVKPQGWPNDHI